MFELECSNCHEITEVDSEEPVVEWTCEHCDTGYTTSLPTNEEGELI